MVATNVMAHLKFPKILNKLQSVSNNVQKMMEIIYCQSKSFGIFSIVNIVAKM